VKRTKETESRTEEENEVVIKIIIIIIKEKKEREERKEEEGVFVGKMGRDDGWMAIVVRACFEENKVIYQQIGPRC